MKRAVVVGITGGTGSGKSTVAKEIFKSLPEKNILIIQQDAYYKKQSHLSMEKRINTNYDHPLAFDTELLIDHLNKLISFQPIEKPIYDFSIHDRKKETVRVEPREIIILEGIMLLEDSRLRDLLDIKIFVDTDPDVRILRRIKRDIRDRGRTLESVVNQYLSTVKPAHNQFIEPTKKYADIIIPEGGYNKVAIDIMAAKVRSVVTNAENRYINY
ncbi:MAG: uridine kinase [Clostridiales bacterium]|nr:MAG: uridine kinase [Clostridiales bacterium]